jgi:hypothetical protein
MTTERIPGTKAIAQAMVDAENSFIETLINLGGISRDDAWKAFATLRKAKALKLDLPMRRYTVKHGAFLERTAIRRAVELFVS